MSLLDTAKTALAEAEAKLEGLDEEALGLLRKVQANPETAVILGDLGSLASVAGIPQGFITGSAAALKVLLAAYAPDPATVQADPSQQQAQQPAGAPAQ